MKKVLESRLTAQLLAGERPTSATAVVEHLLAVQSQDFRAGLLQVRARSTGLVASDVHRVLDDGELVVSWLNRGTLHLVRSEDLPWLHALTTPQLRTANATRLKQEGVSAKDADRGVAVVRKALVDGPQTRKQLRDALETEGVPTARQALVHLLFRATLDGVCVRGPMSVKEQAFVLRADWLPREPKVDRAKALRELGTRYLRSHAPADERDLARWAGITLTDARTAMKEAKQPTMEPAPLPPPRLLGAWDELLMGWASRDLVLGDRQDHITVNGVFKPVILVKGRAVGTWGLPGGRAQLSPFEALPDRVSAALDKEKKDVERFLAG
jgi:hypothetical protein